MQGKHPQLKIYSRQSRRGRIRYLQGAMHGDALVVNVKERALQCLAVGPGPGQRFRHPISLQSQVPSLGERQGGLTESRRVLPYRSQQARLTFALGMLKHTRSAGLVSHRPSSSLVSAETDQRRTLCRR